MRLLAASDETRPSGEAGYGVAEATVALGLVLTVVVPALAALLYFTARSGGSGAAAAAALAQNETELALAAFAADGEGPGRTPPYRSGPWIVERTWREEPEWAALQVTVRRASSSEGQPPAAVQTARYASRETGGGRPGASSRWP